MKIYTVSYINNKVKEYLETENTFKDICVEGLATNITYHEKHLYFTLNDDIDSKIQCVVFSYRYKEIPLDIKKGEKIRVYGDITVYDKKSELQIRIKKIEKGNSLGELFERFLKLKEYYNSIGYFNEENKKKILYSPKIIAVVAGDDSDAIKDIIKNTHQLDDSVNILFYPSRVQGDGAALSIAKGIEFFNDNLELNVECIMVSRGGGSIEDLWAFNEKEVVEAIYTSKIPIISAVGHEADYTLADYVADYRASTPTAAPHIIIKNKADNISKLEKKKIDLLKEITNKIEIYNNKLKVIKENYYIKNFNNTIEQREQLLDYKKDTLNKIKNNIFNIEIKKEKLVEKNENLHKQIQTLITHKNNLIAEKKLKLKYIGESIFNLENKKNNLKTLKKQLNNNLIQIYNKKCENLEKLKLSIRKHNINELFDRGFTLTYVDHKLLKDAKIKKGSKIKTIYKDNKVVESTVD